MRDLAWDCANQREHPPMVKVEAGKAGVFVLALMEKTPTGGVGTLSTFLLTWAAGRFGTMLEAMVRSYKSSLAPAL